MIPVAAGAAPAARTNDGDPREGGGYLQVRRHDAEPVELGDDVVAGDVGEAGAAAERHGELELVPEHLHHVGHPGLARRRQREHHRPADLQR